MRVPFDPPYFEDDLDQMDFLHASIGLEFEWAQSQERHELSKKKRPQDPDKE